MRALLLAVLIGAAPAYAGQPCNVISYVQSPVYVQPAQVFYFVGQPIRVEAMVQYSQKAEVKATQNVLTARCVECHGANSSFDLSGPLDADMKASVMSSVLSGQMPKNREPLTAQELGELVNSLFLRRW
jgi:mono/diheme cytochrome c family protein